jgi:hypothetical protein
LPELLGAQLVPDEPLPELAVPGGQSGMELDVPEVPEVPLLPEEPDPIELPLSPDEPELPLPVPVDDDWATAKPVAAISATNNADDKVRIFSPLKMKNQTCCCTQISYH